MGSAFSSRSGRSLTWPQAVGRRLARHHLLEPAATRDLVKVASDICGGHAQVGASADVWERKPKGRRLLIRAHAWPRLSRTQKTALEVQAHRVVEILERECDFELGPVELRPNL